MLRLRAISILTMVALCAMATSATAFDNLRQGFLIGGGIGPSVTKYEGWYETESKFGFGTDFRIGGGVNNQVQLYWLARTAWFQEDYPQYTLYGGLAGTKTITYMNGFYGGGVTYFFQPQAPSWYLVGAMGLVTLSAPFEDNFDDSESGLGFSLGAGWEFSQHWAAEASWSVGDINDVTFQSWKVVVSYLAY